MNAARTLRASRAVRLTYAQPTRRYASDTAKGASSGALTGGLAGAGAAFAVMYGWYHFSGAKTAVQTAKQAKGYVDDAVNSMKLQIQDKVPNPQDALQVLRDTANKYAAFVPGGRAMTDSFFNDIDAIRKHHGDEVDKIVKDAYEDLRKVGSKGFSLDTVSEVFDVLANRLSQIYAIAGDAAEDILENHPELKKKVGGSKEELKKFADRYGPEAKKQIEEVRDQVREIVQGGISWENLQKIQSMVAEKTEQARKAGKEVLSAGGDKVSDKVQPFLDSNLKIKRLVEDNMQVFKDGNISDALNAVYKATTSGDTKPLEDYIKSVKK